MQWAERGGLARRPPSRRSILIVYSPPGRAIPLPGAGEPRDDASTSPRPAGPTGVRVLSRAGSCARGHPDAGAHGMTDVVCALPSGVSLLGEGALWDTAEQRLYWVDIKRREAHRFDPARGHDERWAVAEDVGCLAVRAGGGGLVVALRSGFHFLDPATGRTTPIVNPEPERAENRFNDGKTDRQGRSGAGSMHDPETLPTGSLLPARRRPLAAPADGRRAGSSRTRSAGARTGRGRCTTPGRPRGARRLGRVGVRPRERRHRRPRRPPFVEIAAADRWARRTAPPWGRPGPWGARPLGRLAPVRASIRTAGWSASCGCRSSSNLPGLRRPRARRALCHVGLDRPLGRGARTAAVGRRDPPGTQPRRASGVCPRPGSAADAPHTIS